MTREEYIQLNTGLAMLRYDLEELKIRSIDEEFRNQINKEICKVKDTLNIPIVFKIGGDENE